MNLQITLKQVFQKRNSLNPRYSKNSFARDLGISPTALSQFLSNKRNLSRINTNRVVKSLCLNPDFFQSKSNPSSKPTQLSLDSFSLISNWYHFGILNLVTVDKIKNENQIARRLGLSVEESKDAVQRLLSLGYLTKENGFLKRSHPPIDVGSEAPSEALRKHNREKMELAIAALEKFKVHERDITSLTLTFDPKKMDLLKKEIKKFQDRIDTLTENLDCTEVYSLNVQFFPLSQ